MKKYCEECGNHMHCGSEKIIPFTVEEAKDWVEEYSNADTYIELFGDDDSDVAADSRNIVLCPALAYDRSPGGTGTSARMAQLHARGLLPLNTDFLKNVSNRVADSRGRSKRKVNNTEIDAKSS